MAKEPEKIELTGKATDPLEKLLQDYDQLIHSSPAETQSETLQEPQVSAEVWKKLPELARMVQQAAKQVDSSQVYQTFRLAGTQVIVHDRRDQSEASSVKPKPADEHKMSLEELLVQKGRLTPNKEKSYENYLADPSGRAKMPEPRATEERLIKMLTRFEDLLIKRFEQNVKMTQDATEGQANFLRKTLEQWRGFFENFKHRTVQRTTSLELLEQAVFRDLVQHQGRTTLISDLLLNGGKLEKFIRMRLEMMSAAWVERLAQLAPGAVLSKKTLAELAQDNELQYLVIKEAEGEAAWNQAPTRGLFGGLAKTEEHLSKELGISLKTKTIHDQTKRRRGGAFGKGEEESGEESAQFVPWWSWPAGAWARDKRKGPVRWFVPVTYAVVAIGITLLLWWIFNKI